MRVLVLAAGLAVLLTADARAYKLMDGIVPQPRLQYYVALKDWRKPMGRAVRAINRAHVGVRLVKAKIADNATIQVGRLKKQCGLPGVDGTTQSLQGGYAAIYLPYGCKKVQGTIIAAHELGHALGLLHEDRRCALMNSAGTGPKSIPQNCLGDGHNWLRRPYRSDDLAGLRKLFRNVRPKISVKLTSASSFKIKASDRDGNLSEIKVDYGDGTSETFLAGEPLPTTHAYAEPGTYTLRATALDFYRRKATASVRLTV